MVEQGHHISGRCGVIQRRPLPVRVAASVSRAWRVTVTKCIACCDTVAAGDRVTVSDTRQAGVSQPLSVSLAATRLLGVYELLRHACLAGDRDPCRVTPGSFAEGQVDWGAAAGRARRRVRMRGEQSRERCTGLRRAQSAGDGRRSAPHRAAESGDGSLGSGGTREHRAARRRRRALSLKCEVGALLICLLARLARAASSCACSAAASSS
jgi:hypothetical protein